MEGPEPRMRARRRKNTVNPTKLNLLTDKMIAFIIRARCGNTELHGGRAWRTCMADFPSGICTVARGH
jgi:hypothetical protein